MIQRHYIIGSIIFICALLWVIPKLVIFSYLSGLLSTIIIEIIFVVIICKGKTKNKEEKIQNSNNKEALDSSSISTNSDKSNKGKDAQILFSLYNSKPNFPNIKQREKSIKSYISLSENSSSFLRNYLHDLLENEKELGQKIRKIRNIIFPKLVSKNKETILKITKEDSFNFISKFILAFSQIQNDFVKQFEQGTVETIRLSTNDIKNHLQLIENELSQKRSSILKLKEQLKNKRIACEKSIKDANIQLKLYEEAKEHSSNMQEIMNQEMKLKYSNYNKDNSFLEYNELLEKIYSIEKDYNSELKKNCEIIIEEVGKLTTIEKTANAGILSCYNYLYSDILQVFDVDLKVIQSESFINTPSKKINYQVKAIDESIPKKLNKKIERHYSVLLPTMHQDSKINVKRKESDILSSIVATDELKYNYMHLV